MRLKVQMDSNSVPIHQFHYDSTDYHLDLSTNQKEDQLSKFDNELRCRWDDAMERGLFRYSLDKSKCRVIPGKYRFAMHLNLKRGVERRTPEFMHGLYQPFDPSKFNFTKIKRDEILFNMSSVKQQNGETNGLTNGETNGETNGLRNGETNGETHGETNGLTNGETNAATNGDSNQNSTDDDIPVIINVSPLEYGHVIIVPEINKQLPQSLTLQSIQSSVDTVMLSSSPALRVGFNSLCAYASVNHLHTHAWYVEESLYTENTPVSCLNRVLHRTTEAPVPAFVFQLHGNAITHVVKMVHVVTTYLQNHEIAHNMFITRGDVFGEENCGTPHRTVRIYVWPRKTVTGIKNEMGKAATFHVAVAELGGHIPMYAPDVYDTLTEDDILRVMYSYKLDEAKFNQLSEDLIEITKNYS